MNTLLRGTLSTLPTRRDLGRWALTFILYVLAAKLGQFVYSNGSSAPAFIWPASGLALALAFIWGNRMLSAIALAALVASVSYDSPFAVVISSVVGTTLQALVGATLLRTFEFRADIARLRDTLLLLAAALIITTISPTISLGVRALLGASPDSASEVWRMVWSGGVWSVLVVTPLITSFWHNPRVYRERFAEQAVALLLTCTLTYIVFWKQLSVAAGIPLVYLLLIPLFWIALRFAPRSTALALFLTSIIGASGAFIHPPASITLGQWLFQTQLLFEIFAAIFLIVSSAIEDRRAATAELQAHVTQLEHEVTDISEQDSAKSDFLAILSHELRNPLAPVLSTLELLRLRRRPHEEEAILLSGAEQRLRMMGRLLDDLLDMSRVSEKRLRLQKEHLTLSSIAARSVDSARPIIEKYKHRLEVTLPQHDATLYADPLRIEQILVNVLNNAAKYTPEGGKIEFRAETINGRAMITIRDNGIGIEQKMLERIFEPFIQVSHTKYGTSGVGVGLALAKELVGLHEGKISALSAGLGRGSTFVVEFPTVAPPPVMQPSAPVPPARERQIGTLNILIVDDNHAGAEALSRLLSFRGHKTHMAFSGVEGAIEAAHGTFDAILLDIGLPDIDGYEVARRMRTAGVQSFIIALTGFGQDEDRKKALDAGCDIHLTKPVGLQDIEAALRARFGV